MEATDDYESFFKSYYIKLISFHHHILHNVPKGFFINIFDFYSVYL